MKKDLVFNFERKLKVVDDWADPSKNPFFWAIYLAWAIFGRIWPIWVEINFTRIFNYISLNLLTQKYILSAYKHLFKNFQEISFKIDHVEDLKNQIWKLT